MSLIYKKFIYVKVNKMTAQNNFFRLLYFILKAKFEDETKTC